MITLNSVKKKKVFLIDKGILNGREKGREIQQRILGHLARVEGTMIVDFSRVQFMDFSCADEVITVPLRRVLAGEFEGRFIVLKGLKESVFENVEAVLKLRNLQCIFIDRMGESNVIGELKRPLRETLELVLKRGKITAREAADALSLKINTSSNRLSQLSSLKLIRRLEETPVSRGGRQYVFEAIV
jgi:hypothetical protein